MNIFVLNTGRCGSTTFIRACEHMSNYTAAHESRLPLIGEQRLDYPPNHIEADNRLSWYLGRLEQKYGDGAFYLHLKRDREEVAMSYAKRREFGIMKAYREGILLGGREQQTDLDLALDYVDTVEANIAHFLKDKSMTMELNLASAQADFSQFWQRIDAQGDLHRALAEWQVKYNASDSVPG
jgi:hypothetical protein